jgi:endo-1,4-beta-xylanase
MWPATLWAGKQTKHVDRKEEVMVKRYLVPGLILCAILAITVYGQNNDEAKSAATPAAIGLKDAYAGSFLIGATGDLRGYSDAEWANIKTNYNIITPENCMKPQPIHPSEDTYNWVTSDALVQRCLDSNIKVWGHTLVWHSQTANWFFQPGVDGQPVTRELAMARLKNHIMTVVGRYKGRVIGLDVVNEAIADRGTGETEKPPPHLIHGGCGPSKAFDVTHAVTLQWDRAGRP